MVAIRAPLRLKVLRLCCDLFQVIITPSEERQTALALTPGSLLINRPLLIECNKISDEWEHETTIPRSELKQQERISLLWPRRTCMGPSIRHILLLSANVFDKLLLLFELAVPVPVRGSDMLLEPEANVLRILQSNTVVSWLPETR
ncbi:hypothetical protein PanWU01x14_337950 [Parasponia andersonii]|uniref:Uncharacterized protein n=1 Tax=Parasponia andersonii TaxID=3476 RepID=A0A2P5AFB9_PARAD|nr:hypothetical protein PanWU01x14_337950 [Parasponia andersonii]